MTPTAHHRHTHHRHQETNMTTTTATATTPAVWVGCLACYNAGRLTGDWVNDATEAADYTPCTRTEYGTPHEEWWVMDHEGFDGLLTGECSPAEAAALAERHADLTAAGVPVAAFVAWCDNNHERPADADVDGFQEAFQGTWPSLDAWAAQHLEDAGMLAGLPEWAQAHTDALVGSWLADVRAGGQVWAARNGSDVYVFLNI